MKGQVSLVDVAPTVLDVLEIEAPGSFEGRSLLDASRTGEAAELEAWAETEHTLDGSRKFASRRGVAGEKAIFTLKPEGLAVDLFDLAKDPRESERLDPGARVRAFEEKLADPAFARDPAARLRFFYERHPAFDERYRLYPVLRE